MISLAYDFMKYIKILYMEYEREYGAHWLKTSYFVRKVMFCTFATFYLPTQSIWQHMAGPGDDLHYNIHCRMPELIG